MVDTSGAYIPGHGTPTMILFGAIDRRSAMVPHGDGHQRESRPHLVIRRARARLVAIRGQIDSLVGKSIH